jgi:hypothetical protein
MRIKNRLVAGVAAGVIVLMSAAYATAHGLSTAPRSAPKKVAPVASHPSIDTRRAHHHARHATHRSPAVTSEPGSTGSGDESASDQAQSQGAQGQDEQSADEQSQDDHTESSDSSDSGDEGGNNKSDDHSSGDQGSQDGGSGGGD